MVRACLLAAVASALVMGLCAIVPRRRGRGACSRPVWFQVGWSLSVGAGFYLGCGAIGVVPRWPPLEDLDRFLAFIVPGAIACDLIAAAPFNVPRGPAWIGRFVAAVCVAPVLLHGSIYLSDAAGPGTAEWSPAQSAWTLGFLGAALTIEWALLVRLAGRSNGPTFSLALGLAAALAGSALAIVLSGYVTGGIVGLPMSAAVLGTSMVAAVVSSPTRRADRPKIGAPGTETRPSAPIDLLIAGLAGLLIVGRFFGELRTSHAAMLFLAPLTAWASELPMARRLPDGARGTARVLLVALAVLAVVADVVRRGPLGH